MKQVFQRKIVADLENRLNNGPPLIQVVTGPRQVGKTTAARTVASSWDGPIHFATADQPTPPGPEWVESNWSIARSIVKKDHPALLVLDEVQKVSGWGESVKAMWDSDRATDTDLKVILLGSSALLLSRGTSESLAGRFFLHRCLHWSYPEMNAAFGWDLRQWIYHGGYPGAAPLANEPEAWKSYVADSLIEAVLSRDVLSLAPITKPTLLRHLFLLSASAPCEILSYTKMLGQLRDAGNTTTLAHYLKLLEVAFLVSGLERFSGGRVRKRGSSPKLVPWNNALVTSVGALDLDGYLCSPQLWGRLVENAVGAHLLNSLQGIGHEVTYWRERNNEIDFAVRTPEDLFALEVKSGRPRQARGLQAFIRRYPDARPLIIGSGGLPLEEFFSMNPKDLLSNIAQRKQGF